MESSVREGTVGVAANPATPSAAERWALRVLQFGAILIVLAAVTDRALELDRFFVPKELILHTTACISALLAIRAFRRVAFTWIDLSLTAYLLLGAASAVFAQDETAAVRALSISISGVAVFWAARSVREAGLARPLLRALAVAVMLGAATSLAQAYGITSDLFSTNRAPGGTLGNRNFIAHMAAFGLPIMLLTALRAWRGAGYLLGTAGATIVVATLVITRSRAGWLAFAAVILIFGAGILLSRPLRRHGRTWRRLSGIGLLAAVGVATVILVPNSLDWRSANPYLESMSSITNYQEGSGAGRLVQYRRSMRMALDQPLLGVGPGNWSLAYPEYAAPQDPSLSRSQPGTTANPWPSSDWVAFAAERGFPATIMFALALLGITASALHRGVRARDHDEGLLGLALLATVVATLVAGSFDAVLLLAHPTLLVWAALGAMWSPERVPGEPDSRAGSMRVRAQQVLLALVALAAAPGIVRSASQLSTMTIFGTLPACTDPPLMASTGTGGEPAPAESNVEMLLPGSCRATT